MVRRFAQMAAILAACWSQFVQAQDRVFPVAERPVLEDRYPRQLQSWPGGVTSAADVVYSTIPGFRPLVVDVYTPPREAGPKPLILFIHGGGWTAGHTRHSGALADFPATLAALAAEGFVVASLEYRLAGEAPFPAQLQDARAALRFLKDHAAHFGLDPSHVGVWGGSAGGHLAALTALTCGNREFDPQGTDAAESSECVQAASIWYGVFDFAALSTSRPGGQDGAASMLLRCSGPCTSRQLATASPVTFIDANDPPFQLIHGEGDKTVPVAQSHLAEDRLKAAGVPVESIFIPAVDHSFIGQDAATTRAATLKAVNATFDFFHAKLDAKK